MRDIIFRGLNRLGVWVYGSLDLARSNNPTIVENKDGKYHRHFIGNAKSVGQYTGLKDKNGILIYEGDIVHLTLCHDNKRWDEPTTEEIGFSEENACFGIYSRVIVSRDLSVLKNFHSFETIRQKWEQHSMKIIGNIFENPDLLQN